MNFFRILYIFPIIFFVVVITWIIGFIWFYSNIVTSNSVIDKKYHAIIVLTGAKGRIDAGLQLLTNKYADQLFITGVGENTALKDLSNNLSYFTLEQVNDLKSAIILGHKASSTEENAREAWQWAQQHKFKNIILVTSNYHMPRSLYLFTRIMPEVSITPHAVIADANFQLLLTEYLKYSLTYWKSILYKE